MASMVADAATVQFAGSEPWPENVKLYQPYEVGQILLPDFADCLSVKALLKMCNLPFKVELRTNAEFMSPSGKVPFIQVGKMLISELDPIISFIHAKGYNLSSKMTEEQKADMKAHMSMVTSVLVNAELYASWVEKDILQLVTRPRYGSVYSWPLNTLLPFKKQWEVNGHLKALGWQQKSWDEVCKEIETCCQALSEKLGDQAFFFGEKPTELDALVYGHLYTLITISLPTPRIADVVKKFANLAEFCRNVDRVYFQETEIQRDFKEDMFA